MVDIVSETNLSNSYNNWDNHQVQINKYLGAIEGNPYVMELSKDFKNLSFQKVTKYMSSDWNKKFCDENALSNIDTNTVNNINSLFNTDLLMKHFCKYVDENIVITDDKQLFNFLEKSSLEDAKITISSNMPTIEFNPTDLKFVTTTGLSRLGPEEEEELEEKDRRFSVDYEYLYKCFVPPENIVKSKCHKTSGPIFHKEVINKVIGCKTGNEAIKGYFKKAKVGDFYNCATLQIVLGESKCANAKLFRNGKIQITGIPHPDLGTTAVQIISDLIKSINDCKETNHKIVFGKKHVRLQYYKTVMINTCYDMKISIDRDITSQILSERFNFSTVWEGDGYPGVRVLYYYNENTLGTENEGRCICSLNDDDKSKDKCDGKGTGSGKYDCRKISIAVFQSGKVIIAGGCKDANPIYSVYKTFNNIISSIVHEITKVDDEGIQNKKIKQTNIFIDKSRINNIELYNKLIAQ